MTKREQKGRRALRELAGEVAWELVFAAVIAAAVVALPIGLPSISLPDLPDINLPDWVGTVLKWGKFVVLGALALAFVIGAVDRRSKSHPQANAEGSG
jgi:hypothetical protein